MATMTVRQRKTSSAIPAPTRAPSSNRSLKAEDQHDYDPDLHQRRYSFFLHSYETAPSWLKDNRFIRTSYRVNYSWRLCLKSMFKIHNETMNIWTHFIGALLFIGLLVYTLHSLSPHGIDRVVSNLHHEFETINSYQQNFKDMLLSVRDQVPTMDNISDSLKSQAKMLQQYVELGEHALTGVQAQFLHYTHRIDEVINNMQIAVTKSCPSCSLLTVKDLQRALSLNVQRFSELVDSTSEDFLVVAREKVQSLSKFVETIDNKVAQLVLPEGMMWSDSLTYLSRWPIAVFITTAICCLLFSAIFHLFFCHSPAVSKAFQMLDYAGICLLIAGTSFASIYYMHLCNPFRRVVYSTIVALLPLMAFSMSFSRRLMKTEFAPIRASVFVFVGISVAFPLIQFYVETGFWGTFHWLLLSGGISYIVGAFFYASQIPERLYPGYFDIWFHSHSLFHMFVIAAALLHYLSLRVMYEWRMLHPCPINH